MNDLTVIQMPNDFDALLPTSARHYVAHTVEGRSIREIARDAGCHASTVLRQVRKTEALRDDPLVDQALGDFDATSGCLKMAAAALHKLCLPGAILAFAAGFTRPAIVQSQEADNTQVLGAVDVIVAASLILRGWLTQSGGSSVLKYSVTSEGRAALPILVAAQDARASLFSDRDQDGKGESGKNHRSRDRSMMNGPGSESPLVALARRRTAEGTPFLSAKFVAAGDRLYEDFQIAGFEKTELLGWMCRDVLAPFYERARRTRDARRAEAIIRTLDAISDLGPGLSDVTLRCCCLREGLESAEKRMGWSARSGKVVLRIALQRLCLHYATTQPKEGVLIG